MTISTAFIHELPKVELHLHIEGTLEPATMLELAARNNIALPWSSLAQLRAAYRFSDLQSFLDVYYRGASVLCERADFETLAWAYLERANAQNVRHVEIFFDPQTHTDRDIDIEVVVEGLVGALTRGERELGITWGLIPCFVRHLSAEAAMDTLEKLRPLRRQFVAVGLDSSELGHPPAKFARVFDKAAGLGLRRVAHAGEEGPPGYIWEALDVLGVDRIDHGVRCLEDPALIERLRAHAVPLTVCPLSNVRLRVVDRLEDHPLPELLRRGLRATVNSDDPAYFGGYIGDNFEQCATSLALDVDALVSLSRNAIDAAFIDQARREPLLAALQACRDRHFPKT